MDRFGLHAASILYVIRMKAMKLCLGWMSCLDPNCSAVGKMSVFVLHVCLVSLRPRCWILRGSKRRRMKRILSPLREYITDTWESRDKIWWKGSDCCWRNHATVSHGEGWVGVHLLATQYMKGTNMQLCGSLGQLKCIMTVAYDGNYIFLADNLVLDCWLSVQRQCLVQVSILRISLASSPSFLSSAKNVFWSSRCSPVWRKSSSATCWSPAGVPVELARRRLPRSWPHSPSTGAAQKSTWPPFSC